MNRFIVYLRKDKCHFFNNLPSTVHGFRTVIDPFVTKKSQEIKEFENFSLIYPNLKCKNIRPASFTLEGADHLNRPFLEDLSRNDGGDVVYSAMCQLNGLDFLDSKFNKGTLDLEGDLHEHHLYRDIYLAIQNYNEVYKKMKRKQGTGTKMDFAGTNKEYSLTDQGDIEIHSSDPSDQSRIVLSKDSSDSYLNFHSGSKEEFWPPMQSAKEDLIYEFKILMGRMLQMKKNGFDISIPGDNFKIFRSF